MKLGGKVNVTFHGESSAHEGTVVRIGATVRSVEDSDSQTTSMRVIPVEIALDDPKQMPHILRREAEITFLDAP
jgi:hypothetical protein